MSNRLQTRIAAACVKYPRPHAGMTASGYTQRSGAPTHYMVRLEGENRWRRLYCWQFSNSGTLFLRIKGREFIVNDVPTPS